jgi:uncharacterized membrane protein
MHPRFGCRYLDNVRRFLDYTFHTKLTSNSIRGENQFKNWFIYFLIAFVVSTLLAEIFYLNKALALFNTAMVTPTYYVSEKGAAL